MFTRKGQTLNLKKIFNEMSVKDWMRNKNYEEAETLSDVLNEIKLELLKDGHNEESAILYISKYYQLEEAKVRKLLKIKGNEIFMFIGETKITRSQYNQIQYFAIRHFINDLLKKNPDLSLVQLGLIIARFFSDKYSEDYGKCIKMVGSTIRYMLRSDLESKFLKDKLIDLNLKREI